MKQIYFVINLENYIKSQKVLFLIVHMIMKKNYLNIFLL